MPAQNIRTKLRALSGLIVRKDFVADEDFTAGENLSGSQYSFVVPGSVVGEVKRATGASLPAVFGVLQNAPTSGQTARVRMIGKTLVRAWPAACVLGYGTFITVASTGGACPSGSLPGGPVVGRWVGSAVSTSATLYGEAYVNCMAFPAFTGCPMSTS